MLKRPALFLIFLLASFAGFSQYNQTARERKDSIRAQFIEEYPDHFAVWPMLKYRSLTFKMVDTRQDKRVNFNPNNTYKTGAGFYLFNVSFEITFSIPVPVRDESIYGEAKSTDLQVNILSKSVGLDLYYQKYSGYYRDDKDVEVPKGEPYPDRSDVVTKNMGLSAFYVWNNEKLSIRSSYNYADRQKKSAGSFILYGTINSFTAEGDSALLPASAQQVLGTGSDFNHLRITTVGLAPGYTYNLVLKRIFLNGTCALSPASHWIYSQSEAGKEHRDVQLNTAYTFRLAAGYSGDRFFVGSGIVWLSRAGKLQDIRVENSTGVVRLVVGYRFREKGFLKKNAINIKI